MFRPALVAQVFTLAYLLVSSGDSEPVECLRRTYFRDSFVCVCKISHCDEVEPLGLSTSDKKAVVYTTSLKNDRLKRSVLMFVSQNQNKAHIFPDAVRLTINADRKFQKIIGFGGAITDAAMKILEDLRQRGHEKLTNVLFNQYYNFKDRFCLLGISYTLGRVPIASCDFSTTNYSYLDVPDDFELKSFKLSDFEYGKWEFLARAQQKSVPPLRLFASPWSAPAWIKTNGQMQGGLIRGAVEERFFLLYAKYFIRFFEEYAKRGVRFWATTVQNEPSMADKVPWQNMHFDILTQKKFVKLRLKPLMRQNWATKDLKIMGHDDFRGNLRFAAKTYYAIDGDLIDGMAFHWYGGGNYNQINDTFQMKPDKFLLSTEACNAYDFEHAPQLGYWEYAQRYAHDIIETLLNNAAGWTDWNIWLDEQGGPNWVGNFVDAPIIVNITSGEFYKQPMYYIMGHFSKFILPDSTRIDVQIEKAEDQFETVAFELPDHKITVVLLNKSENETLNLLLTTKKAPGKHLVVTLEAKSIKTIIWN